MSRLQLFIAAIYAVPLLAQQPTFKSSIDQQKASILRQTLGAVPQSAPPAPSWFSTPWPANPTPPTLDPSPLPPLSSAISAPPTAACDPITLDKIQPLIKDAATRQGLREDLVRSVIERESAFKPCAVSPKGAQGLMQLMPATAQQLGVTNPLDPAQNIDGGTRYLKQLLDKYKGSIELALAAYNAGPGRVDKDGGVPAIPETRDYVLGIVSKLIY